MSLVKYRLKEVAADFGVQSKEITEIISKYGEKPKSPTQVMTDEELNIIFDYMTQNNQISSLEVVFAVQPKPVEPKPEPKAEAPKADAPKASPKAEAPKKDNKPAAGKPQTAPKQESAPVKVAEPERKRERRVVDTSAVQVNTNRFADVDNLVSEREQNYQGGKQKFGKKGQQQNKKMQQQGKKSRNQEQEKMRRLQM